MSNGITGPLSLMAIALIYNVEIEGQREAIQKIVSTIDSFRYTLGQTIYWPERIKFEEFINGECMHNGERASWCYGSPGIARAIYLAGKAINNEQYKKTAVEALDSLCSLSEDLWVLKSPTFCHGYAGSLRITHCMYLDTGLEKFNCYSDKILNKILSFYDENSPFGFSNIDIIDIQKDIQYKKFNSCGLLKGSVVECFLPY